MFVDICGCYKLGVSGILKEVEPSILCNAPPNLPAPVANEKYLTRAQARVGTITHSLGV